MSQTNWPQYLFITLIFSLPLLFNIQYLYIFNTLILSFTFAELLMYGNIIKPSLVVKHRWGTNNKLVLFIKFLAFGRETGSYFKWHLIWKSFNYEQKSWRLVMEKIWSHNIRRTLGKISQWANSFQQLGEKGRDKKNERNRGRKLKNKRKT